MILYSFRRCPYAIRARMALAQSGIHPEIREVVLKNKPHELLQASQKGTVPVLITSEKVLDESLDIMLFCLNKTKSTWLDFTDTTMQQIIALIQRSDTEFKYHLDRYKYPQRYDNDPIIHREKAQSFLHQLEQHLQKSKFLYGDMISLADIAIFPFIRQFSKVEPDWFLEIEYKRVVAWLQFHLNSELFQKVMKKYKPWKQGDEPIYFS